MAVLPAMGEQGRRQQRRLFALWLTALCIFLQISHVPAGPSRFSTVGVALAAVAVEEAVAAGLKNAEHSEENVVVVDPGSSEYQAYVLYNTANREADTDAKLQLLRQASCLKMTAHAPAQSLDLGADNIAHRVGVGRIEVA